jgi:hypothetical protein
MERYRNPQADDQHLISVQHPAPTNLVYTENRLGHSHGRGNPANLLEAAEKLTVILEVAISSHSYWQVSKELVCCCGSLAFLAAAMWVHNLARPP